MEPTRNQSTTLSSEYKETEKNEKDNKLIRLNDFIKEEDFVCPITLDVMVEPLKLFPCGHHADTVAYEGWKKTAQKLANCCPLCKEVVKNTAPDYFLKEMINRWNRLKAPSDSAPLEKDHEAVQLPLNALQSLENAKKFCEAGNEQKALDLILELQEKYSNSKDIEEALHQILQKINLRTSKKRTIDLTDDPEEAPEPKQPRINNSISSAALQSLSPIQQSLQRNSNGKYSLVSFFAFPHEERADIEVVLWLHIRRYKNEWDLDEELNGNSLLHFAVCPSLPCPLLTKFPRNFHKLLVDIGANINKQNRWGDTPLHLAASASGGEKFVRFLLKKGARVDIRNSEGKLAHEHTRLKKKLAIFYKYHSELEPTQNRLPAALPLLPQENRSSAQEREKVDKDWVNKFFS